ncbi:MAG: hypothetical protein GEU88_14545 [Solirubrobacterales bacterium]|nr:hypothetical protein [Solirubrobacterales bacterium]
MLHTKLKTIPPREGQSRYDFLLDEALDRDVVVLERGEDFPAELETGALRSGLRAWARSREVKVRTRVCSTHPETGKPSRHRDADGRPLPFGMYVQVTSAEGARKGRKPRRAGAS